LSSSIANSSELLEKLYALSYDNPSRDRWWWPESGGFTALVGAILTQNTTWTNVEKSLSLLNQSNMLNIDTIAATQPEMLYPLIRSSGYYRNKSNNLVLLARNILDYFVDFESFRGAVDRTWLLEQKGIGNETADAILCYTCYREAMVVDNYTARLLIAINHPQPNYHALQSWLLDGIEHTCDLIFPDQPLALCYARYHGMIVEYCKTNKIGKEIDVTQLASQTEHFAKRY